MAGKQVVLLTADEASVVVAGLRQACAFVKLRGQPRAAKRFWALADRVEERLELAWEKEPVRPEKPHA